jgi:hypothetical protein
MVEIKKKLKDGYPKLILFKVWVPFFKSDERSGVISKVVPFFLAWQKFSILD